MNGGGTTLRRPFRMSFLFCQKEKNDALYDYDRLSGKSTIPHFLLDSINYPYQTGWLVEKMMIKQVKTTANLPLRQDNPEQIWWEIQKRWQMKNGALWRDFPYVKSYLIKKSNRPLLVEGAGLLPHLVKKLECPASSYLCLTPTADFQKKEHIERMGLMS